MFPEERDSEIGRGENLSDAVNIFFFGV